ncbi:MAG: XRE family transcriptional regulator [Sphingomonas sp.]|nr:XRE family transcriptional regulator [Sphingomonas sp.]
MSLGQRIAEARRAKGWSQQQLADAIGSSQSTVAGWETDKRTPKRADVARIAIKTGVSVAELEGVDFLRSADPALQEVPLLSWVSAGAVADAGSLGLEDAEDFYPAPGLPPGRYFATEVRGDSMDRISPEGSVIIVNAADRRLVSGKPYVFRLGGETTYKLFFREPVTRLEPYSTNPINKTIFPNDREWSVVGRVVRSVLDL